MAFLEDSYDLWTCPRIAHVPNIGALLPLQADLSSSVDSGDRLDKI